MILSCQSLSFTKDGRKPYSQSKKDGVLGFRPDRKGGKRALQRQNISIPFVFLKRQQAKKDHI
jgi:hypothetical protein